MNKKLTQRIKKLKTWKIGIPLILIVVLLAGIGIVKAKVSIWDKIAEVAGTIVGNELSEQIDDFTIEEDLTVGVLANEFNFNMQQGTFADATTTLVSVQNPFSATATVELLVADVQGVATTSIVIECGTSTKSFGAPTDSLLDGVELPTSTRKLVVSGTNEAGTKSQSRITVGPNEYVLCHATSTTLNASQWGSAHPDAAASLVRGITGDSNTFTGEYTFEWFNWPK